MQDEGLQIVGHSADEMMALQESNVPLFEARLAAPQFRPYIFKLRASEDTWQDEQRVRINVVRCGECE